LADDANGSSQLPAPKKAKLVWQTTPPAAIPTESDHESGPHGKIPVKTTTIPRPKTPPATPVVLKIAPPRMVVPEKDPPVAFKDVKVTTASSSILEPVAANNGNVVFYTGNFMGGAESMDGGSTWKFTGSNSKGQWVDLNGDLQCGCDQDVVYAPQINKFIWYRQGGGNDWTKGQQEPNSITLIDGSNPETAEACSFTLYPSTVNASWGAPYWFDYPALALGPNFVYLTTNLIDNQGGGDVGSVIVRFNLTALNNACFNNGKANIDWYLSSTSNVGLGLGAANGSADVLQTMLFAAHLSNNQLRIYSWPESASHTGVTSTDITHTAYNPPNKEQCVVPDGGNPCNSLQTWYITGWSDRANGTATFMWNAGANPPSQKFPYLHMVTVNAFPGHIGMQNEADLWSPNFAFLVGAGGVDTQGRPAATAFIAGGTTSPTPIVWMPTEGLNYVQLDSGKASGTKTTNRWGDYLRVRPYYAGPGGSARAWSIASYFYPATTGGDQFNYYQVSCNTDTNFTVSIEPTTGSVSAGGIAATGVTVTSLNGIQTVPITMRVAGLTDGAIQLGTENLTGRTCTFPTPAHVGSTCFFPLQISTVSTDPTGTYTLTVWAEGASAATAAGAQYALTIGSSVGPSPVIVSPQSGADLNLGGTYTLTGWAKETDQPQLIGFEACNSMSFVINDAAGHTQTLTPTQDASYQQTGYCDASAQFNTLGQATIALNAKNKAGVVGQTHIVVNVVNQPQGKFVFQISALQPGTRVLPGGNGTVNLSLTAVSGTPQSVQLSASGLPAGATAQFSPNPTTPTSTATVTFNSTTATPPGSYNVTITGTDTSGVKATATVGLYIDSPAQ
jgi:hypothetical protein